LLALKKELNQVSDNREKLELISLVWTSLASLVLRKEIFKYKRINLGIVTFSLFTPKLSVLFRL